MSCSLHAFKTSYFRAWVWIFTWTAIDPENERICRGRISGFEEPVFWGQLLLQALGRQEHPPEEKMLVVRDIKIPRILLH
jgi:hypothetical protein